LIIPDGGFAGAAHDVAPGTMVGSGVQDFRRWPEGTIWLWRRKSCRRGAENRPSAYQRKQL